jgi:hypothetical protein
MVTFKAERVQRAEPMAGNLNGSGMDVAEFVNHHENEVSSE